MSIVKKLSMATAGAAFIALGVSTTAPATAASLDFSFTTESGGTGSFTLDTDTAPDPNPALVGPAGGPFEEAGTVYTSAISNFSVSTPDVNLSGVTADFHIDPVLDFGDVFGIPDIKAVVSSVAFPVGCLTATDFVCPVDVPIAYVGNVSEISV
jgi:hypothetical protein